MAGTRAEREARQTRAERLGRGLKLEPAAEGGALAFDLALAADGSGPILVEGMDALVQDLRMALMTGLGTDPFDLAYGYDGVPALATETDPLLLRQRLRVGVVRVLQADPRVTRLVSVEALDDPAVIAAAAAGATDGRPGRDDDRRRLQLVASFQVEDGATGTVAVGVGEGT